MLKSTARPTNSTPNATEIRFSEPIASAANAAVRTSPHVTVTRLAATSRHERSPAKRITSTEPIDRRAERSAPCCSVANWSSSSATEPVIRTRTPLPSVNPSSSATRRISSVAAAPGSLAQTVVFVYTAAPGGLDYLVGLWAEKFDHLAAVTTFIVMPMSFLSGTFYTVSRLPEPFRSFSHYNPFFYMISGFRYGFIDQTDSSLVVGVVVVAALNLILAAACLISSQNCRRSATSLSSSQLLWSE